MTIDKHTLKPATLKDLQVELLKLLKIIDKTCKENNIQYWLDAGTLLGAVRHKGYIPWDDDIDIMVSYSDMLKSEIGTQNYLYRSVRIKVSCPD